MSTDDQHRFGLRAGRRRPAPDAASTLRRRMASSAEGFLGSAAWVPWKREGTPEGGSVAHVMIRDLPFVPVFTDPAELAAGNAGRAGAAGADGRTRWGAAGGVRHRGDPTSAEAANFLHADVLAGMRAAMRAGVTVEDDEG